MALRPSPNDYSDEVDGFAEVAAASEAIPDVSTSIVPIDWTSRLTPDGDPMPQAVLRNARDFGYSSPREMFMMEREAPSMRVLAMVWRVPQSLLTTWRSQQDWSGQRRRWWEDQQQRAWEFSNQQLAELRGQKLQDSLRGYQNIAHAASKMAERGYKTRLNPTNGEVIPVDFEPRDINALAKAFDTATKGILMSVGLNTTVQKEALGEADDDNGNVPVVNMVFNFPADETEQEKFNRTKMLPSGETVTMEVMDSVEGEIQ